MTIYKSLDDNKLVAGIQSGWVGVIPTDTIYGLVARATNKDAVKRVYDVKSRSVHKPFIILIAEIADLGKFNVSLPIELLSQVSDYWPGPNSLILECDDPKYEYLTRGTETLAFRLPNNNALREFIRKTGPLVAPSANPEGREPAKDINTAIKYFGNKIDFYVDGGKLVGRPSNLVDFSNGSAVKLR